MNQAETFTLYQLPNQTHVQMMSYIIKTVNGKLIVIDGGTENDADYLRSMIVEMGGAVDTWYITHTHSDHMNALGQILPNLDEITINRIAGSFNTKEWHHTHCTELEISHYNNFMAVLKAAGRTVEELSLGQSYELDGTSIQVLGIKNPEIQSNPINNSSIVLRIWDSHKSILLLSDLGVEGGNKLLNTEYAQLLPSDYVQMAHHGQKGVSNAFYQKVNPTYCLWTAPQWLWDNDDGEGINTGPWETIKTREWLKQNLPIKKHYCIFEGLAEIT